MAVVGSAEVIIRALTTQLKADIKKGLQEAANDAEKQGGVAGDNWVKGFKDRVQSQLNGAINFDVLGNAAAEAGIEAGGEFGRNAKDSADKEMGSGGGGGGGLKSIFRRAVPDASSAGADAGGGFAKGFGGAASAAGGAGGFFGAFFLKLLIFLPIITTLIAALSALASGLLAMGAAAGVAAVGGLLLLPGVIGAVIAAVGVLAIALSGISKAFQEYGQAQAKGAALAMQRAVAERNAARAVRQAARGIVDAQERVSDAQERVSDAIRALDRARRDAARGAEDASRRVVDAEERLVDAQERAQRAQADLVRAREDAAERLEDLQLALRGSVLGEQEAVLRLQQARKRYMETLRDPGANGLDREQARIDLQQAELALDTAKDRRDDVTKQTQEANQAGVEGSDEVVQAKEEINDANKNVADSERELARARQDQALQAIDAAERISDAQEAVRDAYKGVADAVRGVADAQERYRDAVADAGRVAADFNTRQNALLETFNKLSPAGQSFVIFLDSLRGQFRQLKQDLETALLPPLQRFLTALLTGENFRIFREGLTQIATALGRVFDFAAKVFTTDAARKDFATFLRVSATLSESFGKALVIFLQAISSLTAGAAPFLERFGKFIEKIATNFLDFVNNARADGSLTMWFDLAFKAASAFGRVFGAVFKLFEAILPLAATAGIELLNAFAGVTEKAAEFFKTEEGQARLKEFFDNIVPNVKAVASLLGAIGAAFLRIGENPAIKEIADQLRTEFVPALERVINGITKNLGPGLFKAITGITQFVAAVSESQALKGFVNLLGEVFAFLGRAADFGFVNEIIAVIAIFGAGTVAGGRLFKMFDSLKGTVLRFGGAIQGVFRFVFGLPGKIIRVVQIIVANLKLIGFVLRGIFAANPLGLIITGLILLGTALFAAYQRFEGFRNVVNGIFGFIRDLFLGFIGFIVGWATRFYDAFIRPFVDAAREIFGNSIIPDLFNGIAAFITGFIGIITGILGAIRDVFVGIFNAIKAAVEFVVGVIATVITTYVNIWRTIIETALNIIKAVVSTIFNAIKFVISNVFNGIKAVFEFVIGIITTIWNRFWNNLKFIGETVFNAIKTVVSTVFGAIKGVFERIIGGIKTVWDGLWNTLSSVASTVFGGIKGTIERILGGIKTGFETTVGHVKTAWDKFKEIVTAPIRSVVDIAYNKGIVKFWNNVAGAVGAPKLDEVKFAKGGLVPGYAPGQDRVRALLSPGEGILVPEAVRGLARQMGTTPAKAIQSINSQWTSRVPGTSGRFAGGGYVSGSTRNAWGGPLDYVKNPTKIFSDSFDWILGQLAKGAKVILEGAYTLVDDALPDNKFGNLLGKAPRKIGSKILEFLERKDRESEDSGDGVGSGKIGDREVGSGYRSLVRVFKESGLPGVVTSTIRRARFSGDQSNHIRGLAADFSGNHGNRGYGAKVLRDIFHLFADNYGKDMRELILAGAPFNIKRGKKVPGYSWGKPGKPGNHWNHVHAAAMAKGGTVLPRPGGTLALLAEAGKAESVVDTGLLNKRLADLADAKDGSRSIIAAIERQNAILERIGALGGINIERIDATTADDRDRGASVARSMRRLAFELGQ